MAENPPLILVAMPDDLREPVCRILSAQGLLLREADTYAEALDSIRSEAIDGMIMISSWAVPGSDGMARGLFVESNKRIPAIVLVLPGPDFYYYFKQYYALYLPFNKAFAFDDYIHVPFEVEALMLCMKRFMRAIEGRRNEQG